MIKIEKISKRYMIGRNESYYSLRDQIANFFSFKKRPKSEEFWALKNINLEIKKGETIGIIGRNGAGKSTLLKVLSQITPPTTGRIQMHGRVASLLEVGTGFHPELTGRENIFLNGAILGMSRAEIKRKFDDIVAFAEIGSFLDTPVKKYSSGMYVRLAFAVAAHLEPEILIVDEVLAVGDAKFQKKSLGKMSDIAHEGRTVIFVSHNMASIKALCSRAIVLEHGKKVFDGDTLSAVGRYEGRDKGKRSVIEWTKTTAPRLKSARLLEVGILSDNQNVGVDLSSEKPIQVYIKFEMTSDEDEIGATVDLFNENGDVIFSSIGNNEPDWHMKKRPKGVYVSTCEIPANILRDGPYSVSILLWSGFYEDSIREEGVLNFNIHEEGLIQGDYPRGGVGIINPLLKWTSVKIKDKK
ncbi:MAG: polysaccharide ABC transporter ATP-binding protein [Candidatus Berkelbacteria bacterium]